MLANLASKNPIQISAAIIAVVNFLIIMDWISMTADQVSALNIALGAVLGLFIVTNTVNTAKMRELEPGPDVPEGGPEG